MKKAFVFLMVLAVAAGVACADVATVTVSVTNDQAISFSGQIPASGELDAIEIVQTSTNATVTLATYSGTTALQTFASLTTLTTATKVVRPRLAPTDNTGTAVAAVSQTNSAGTVTTLLAVPYDRPVIGGNLKLAVTAGNMAPSTTNTVTATLYFTKPMKW